MDEKISLQYIGNKGEFADTNYGTGVWETDEVKKVSRETAAYMLFHDDVWRDARPAVARKKDPITPMRQPRVMPQRRERDPTPVNILMLDTKGCVDYASREFGVTLPTDLKPAVARERVRALMRERA